ncbi:MAG: GBS Bsp-like repeat-containing protein [Oliverpabstia sp.]
MHFKNVMKRIAVIGLSASLCVSNVSSIAAADIEMKQEQMVDTLAAEDDTEDDTEVFDEKDSETEDADGGSEPETEDEETGAEDSETEAKDEETETEDSETDTEDEETEVEEEAKPFDVTKAEFQDSTEMVYEMELSHCEMEDGDSLEAAVWSDDNGQDDLKWITLEKKEDDKYGLTINISDFKSPGLYYAHIYRKQKDGSQSCVVGKEFSVTEISEGTVNQQEQVYEEGTAVVKISGVSAPSGIKKIRAAAWSTSDQSDLYWYNAEKKDDGWYVNMNISKYHKNNWGVYTVEAYAADNHGFEKLVGKTNVDFSVKTAPIEISVDRDSKTAEIALSSEELKTPGALKSIRCAVWSETNGQDDLKWYELEHSILSKTWSQKIPLTMFKSTGTCYIHVYGAKSDKTEIFLGGKSFVLENPSINVSVSSDNAKGTYSIVMDNLKAPWGADTVEAAVWSQGDQSNLKWYKAEVNDNGTYTITSDISKHKYDIGVYNIHVYITDELGIKNCVNCKTVEFKSKIGALKSTDDNSKETTYTVSLPVEEYPAGLKEVRFAVWSNANGQDDLKWYTATQSGTDYQATVDIRNHKTGGTYSVHAYGINGSDNAVFLADNGELINVKGTASGKLSVTEASDTKGTFKVVVSNVSAVSGVNSVRVGAWTQNDQSDVYWYNCSQQSDGSWAAEVNIANHKYHSGVYNIHVYTTMGNEIDSFTAGTNYEFYAKNLPYVLNNLGKGKRTLGVCGPTSTSDLKFAVWSETGGQDDITWYQASKAEDGNWTAVLLGKNHKHGGTFNLHVYSGSNCLATTTFTLPADEIVKNGWYYEKMNGKTYKLYYVDGVLQKDVHNIIGRQSRYVAEVNRQTCTVNIYASDGANGYIIPVIAFTCSVGMPDTPTPTGTFHTLNKYRWHELMGPSYGQYCTRIVGGILFHSVAGSNMTSYNLSAAEYNKLGQPASHGCVRLCVRDAKWIYDNCELDMEVRIFDSSFAGPFGKPATIKIPASQNWDPTDPNI